MDAFDDETVSTRKARIEIIPLIDVIFFLLATFVLFTLSLQRVRLMDAELPKTGDERSAGEETVFIHASADGTFHWQAGANGIPETIATAELGPRLQQFRRTVQQPRVLLRSDAKRDCARRCWCLTGCDVPGSNRSPSKRASRRAAVERDREIGWSNSPT